MSMNTVEKRVQNIASKTGPFLQKVVTKSLFLSYPTLPIKRRRRMKLGIICVQSDFNFFITVINKHGRTLCKYSLGLFDKRVKGSFRGRAIDRIKRSFASFIFNVLRQKNKPYAYTDFTLHFQIRHRFTKQVTEFMDFTIDFLLYLQSGLIAKRKLMILTVRRQRERYLRRKFIKSSRRILSVAKLRRLRERAYRRKRRGRKLRRIEIEQKLD